MSFVRSLVVGVIAVLSAPFLHAAEVSVDEPWVRGTVAAQKATGAFMRLTAASPLRLVGASSPVAATVEVHEMAMEHNVMKMRPVAGLSVPMPIRPAEVM